MKAKNSKKILFERSLYSLTSCIEIENTYFFIYLVKKSYDIIQ